MSYMTQEQQKTTVNYVRLSITAEAIKSKKIQHCQQEPSSQRFFAVEDS